MIKYNMKLRLSSKMMVLILSTCLLIFGVAIGYISFNAKKNALLDAKSLTDSYAREFAKSTESDLNSDMDMAKAMAISFSSYKRFPFKKYPEYYQNILENLIRTNQNYISVWLIWELSTIDSTWKKPYGRGRYTYYKGNGTILYKEEILNTEGDNIEGAYYKMKVAKKEAVIDPYLFSYTGSTTDQILETSLCVPILNNNEFKGLAGIDLPLDRYKEIIGKIMPFENSFAYLIANDGTLVAHPNHKLVSVKITDAMADETKEYDLLNRIKEGKSFSYIKMDAGSGEARYISYVPIKVGESVTPWSLALSVPVEIIMAKANHSFRVSIFVALIGLILMGLVIITISKNITKPLLLTTHALKILAEGAVDKADKLNITTQDEIGEMAISVNKLIDGLNSTAGFATQIGKGNLDAEYSVLSNDDLLGNSLLDMRKSLKHAEEEEKKRKIEDEKQNWITKGIARFSDILRQNNTSIDELSYNIMSNLVNYLGANQGALFIKNDSNPDDIVFELRAAIAFDRRKLMKKQVREGEELVGRCAHEKLTIYMLDVPADYVHITSGLGEANPRCILLVPIKLNDDIFGVLEVVSFNSFEKYQIEFVEKIGESIASTISSVKISEKTAQLLQQAQIQSEDLASKEEEMRQNLEELQATQEESARREMEMSGLWNALNSAALVVEFDLKGNIVNINERNLQVVGATREIMIGKNIHDLAAEAKADPVAWKRFWDDVKSGKTRSRTFHQKNEGQDIWVSETYTPILDATGKPLKILSIGLDITQLKMSELKYQEELKRIQTKK